MTFIDHNKGIVANGSVLGKEFWRMFNELYPAPEKEVREVAERQAEQKHEESKNHAANPTSGIVDTVLDLADTRAYEEQQRLIQRRKNGDHISKGYRWLKII